MMGRGMGNNWRQDPRKRLERLRRMMMQRRMRARRGRGPMGGGISQIPSNRSQAPNVMGNTFGGGNRENFQYPQMNNGGEQGLEKMQPYAGNQYSPTGGMGFNTQNMMRRNRPQWS